MANFDTNHWYQLSVGDSNSMVGTGLYDAGRGAVFVKATNSSNPDEQWQLFPFNSSYYVLRTKESGAQSYLNTATETTETTPGSTVPNMTNSTLSDDSMFWQISPWGDGTFYFTNAANGTAWHLNVKGNTLMSMSSNITAPQAQQGFTFTQLDTIDNVKFSSVITPSATTTSTATSTSPSSRSGTKSSSTHSSSTTSSQSSTATDTLVLDPSFTSTSVPVTSSTSSPTTTAKKGLSSGASAAIGAVGGAALIALACLIGYILYRRRNRSPKVTHSLQSNEDLKDLANGNSTELDVHSNGYGQLPVYGMGGHSVAELVGQNSSTELPSHSSER
ncbi:hypothetical protein B7494_g3734 [Chlorociboria aeruginascens]|nr:hypothetical protein B7494_g3734 [Chlorociboria aeruginascens]